MKTVLRLIPVAIVVSLFAISMGTANAQATNNQNQTIDATITSSATLILGTSTITFPDEDPGTHPSVAQSEGVWNITSDARTTSGSTVNLTVLANGDLADAGSDTIGINEVTWAATGTGYSSGTLNKTTAQQVGQWTGSGSYGGTMEYSLANLWTYATGSYTQTITYTLTCP